ncbi:class I SAM-dependent methyltransferase [Novosphingobium sp. RD2P27]|uniref:Class I SAM-dependent methyltransferase n=1 Tax=Novosphingobium kalidii TaxID=3230299 RepID=A0ABV2D3E7_9SPHN
MPNESEEELTWRRNLAYFANQKGSVQTFWHRFSWRPPVEGKRVLELGCGHGTLSVGLVQSGASEVWAFDLDQERIDFAQKHTPLAHPSEAPSLHFRCEDVCDHVSPETEGTFDLIVSKDTFEHIVPLDGTVEAIRRLLKPGGYAVIGASPLYYSPFGDHTRYLGRGRPWATLLPEPILFALAERRTGQKIRHAHEVGLNKMTPAQFRKAFPSSHWRAKSLEYNRGGGLGMKVFRILRRIPLLEPIFTINVYAVMERIK